MLSYLYITYLLLNEEQRYLLVILLILTILTIKPVFLIICLVFQECYLVIASLCNILSTFFPAWGKERF